MLLHGRYLAGDPLGVVALCVVASLFYWALRCFGVGKRSVWIFQSLPSNAIAVVGVRFAVV